MDMKHSGIACLSGRVACQAGVVASMPRLNCPQDYAGGVVIRLGHGDVVVHRGVQRQAVFEPAERERRIS